MITCSSRWVHDETTPLIPLPVSFLLRDIIKRIDQSEFEGFEYINPLLLSTEESVWRGDQLPPSPTYCLSKLPSQPKTTREPILTGGAGRVKDNRDELTPLDPDSKSKANTWMGEFPSLDDSWLFSWDYQTLLSWYLQEKQKTLDYREHSPRLALSSPLFFRFRFRLHSFSLLRMSILVLKHDQLCRLNRELFSFGACRHEHISTRLTSLDEYDSSAEELEILWALLFIFFRLIPFFYLVGGGRLTQNENVQWQRKKNKLLLCIIM